VEQVMGYKMDGCMSNMTEITESQGVKEMMWDYLTYEIGKRKGEVVILGDFNEVRYKSNMFGSVFIVQGANVFNSFITNAGLEEVPLGGSSFTFFHHWIEMEGFSKFVEDTWREGPCDESNAMINMMIKLKYLKTKIREWNKKNMLSAKNVKAKYKDELEALEAISDKGDGNVESLLNIRGIMVDVMWIESPNRVKGEFFHHFSSRFDKPDARRAHIEMWYLKTLTCDQQMFYGPSGLYALFARKDASRALAKLCFVMKDLGEAAYILGIKIYRDRSRRLIGLCQSAYIEKILKRFHMENSKRESDIKQELRVSCYTDAGYLTDADDLQSQTGYVFVLNGGAVDWKSTKQSIFVTSSAETEYIAACDAFKEAVWIRKFISGLDVIPTIEEPIKMYYDNTEAIPIANIS
nr:retrovirus-related Pol polyprotein from transposon TNT 1-94 [Tanacetum cinerariifolium]